MPIVTLLTITRVKKTKFQFLKFRGIQELE